MVCKWLETVNIRRGTDPFKDHIPPSCLNMSMLALVCPDRKRLSTITEAAVPSYFAQSCKSRGENVKCVQANKHPTIGRQSFQNLDKKTKKALTCGMTPKEQGRAIREFYQHWASKLKWMPMFVSNWILRRNYGLWNLNCQIRWTDVKFQCQCALICDECASFIHNEQYLCSLCQTDAHVLLKTRPHKI
jgi:hypothetical protein